MNTQEHEETTYLLAQSRIAQRCYGKWCAIETSDRRQEAAYVFLCTLRTPPSAGCAFWECYEDALVDYMNPLNRNENLNKRVLSLDAALRTKTDDRHCTLMDFLPTPAAGDQNDKIWRFLHTLPEQEKEFCEQAIFDCKYKTLCSMSHSSKEIMRMRISIAKKYRFFDANYIG